MLYSLCPKWPQRTPYHPLVLLCSQRCTGTAPLAGWEGIHLAPQAGTYLHSPCLLDPLLPIGSEDLLLAEMQFAGMPVSVLAERLRKVKKNSILTEFY